MFLVRCVLDSANACSNTSMMCTRFVGSIWNRTVLVVLENGLSLTNVILALLSFICSESSVSSTVVIGVIWCSKHLDAIYMEVIFIKRLVYGKTRKSTYSGLDSPAQVPVPKKFNILATQRIFNQNFVVGNVLPENR